MGAELQLGAAATVPSGRLEVQRTEYTGARGFPGARRGEAGRGVQLVGHRSANVPARLGQSNGSGNYLAALRRSTSSSIVRVTWWSTNQMAGPLAGRMRMQGRVGSGSVRWWCTRPNATALEDPAVTTATCVRNTHERAERHAGRHVRGRVTDGAAEQDRRTRDVRDARR